jgi:hypothetical protein
MSGILSRAGAAINLESLVKQGFQDCYEDAINAQLSKGGARVVATRRGVAN